MANTYKLTDLVVTGDVLKVVGAIDEFRGAWKAIGRIAPERLSALRRVAAIESAASSTRIEGAKLTEREVELVGWVDRALKNNEAHSLIVIAVFIVSFLAIHPFQDGNGRLSRVLTTLLLLRSGYTYVRYSSLESVIEQTKERYYIALRQTQSSIRTPAPDWFDPAWRGSRGVVWVYLVPCRTRRRRKPRIGPPHDL